MFCCNFTALQEAAALFQGSVSRDSNDERSWLQSGLLQRRKGDFAGARECFRRGAQAGPRNALIHQAWGVLEKMAGDVAAAREVFRRGNASCPKCGPCPGKTLEEEKNTNNENKR
jgi:tetratricopeptide (TPR) repeat protein